MRLAHRPAPGVRDPWAVTDVADALVSRRFRIYDREWHGEWERAHLVRTAIDVFREPVG
ncbi:hypothetical protein ACFUTV_42665 [Streptomyces sp. NPDC057298]|uniref:hypothetical protein n=1 Tax=Streptomyces sp. NPDC057298 TaxID=3346091 RepID=UPI003627E88A